jgi:hypothetical protein
MENASAAASKAGPRLADVAGSFRLKFPGSRRFERREYERKVSVFLVARRLLRAFECTDYCVRRCIENDRVPSFMEELGYLSTFWAKQFATMVLEGKLRIFQQMAGQD